MNCYSCAREIPDPVFDASSAAVESAGRSFRCPLCDALHIRRIRGVLPDGRPVYEFRLWGHPVTTRRRRVSPPGNPKAPILV